jgi:hypothetical protein
MKKTLLTKFKRPNKKIIKSQTQNEEDVHKRIAEKAYDIYVRRGRVDGHDCKDWHEAEQIIKALDSESVIERREIMSDWLDI